MQVQMWDHTSINEVDSIKKYENISILKINQVNIKNENNIYNYEYNNSINDKNELSKLLCNNESPANENNLKTEINLQNIELLLNKITKKQFTFIDESINKNNINGLTNITNLDEKHSFKLYTDTKLYFNQILNLKNIPIFNADNGQAFIDINTFCFPYETMNNFTTEIIFKNRNIPNVVCDYMKRKQMVDFELVKSFKSLEMLYPLHLKLNNTRFTNLKLTNLNNLNNINDSKCLYQKNLKKLSNDDIKCQENVELCSRLRPFDLSKKHLILASLPHQYINRLNKRVYINSKKAAFFNHNFTSNLQILRKFDSVIERIPNGTQFRPMHRARKRRTFGQLLWIADYHSDMMNFQNNDQNKTNSKDINGTDSNLRARTIRRDYSALFDYSSDDSYLNEDFDDSLVSDLKSSYRHSKKGILDKNHNYSSFYSKIHGSIDKSSKVSSFSKNQTKNNDYMILPTELMPVVHIEPIVYKEVVTPVWDLVTTDKLEWLKGCYKRVVLQNSNNITISTNSDCQDERSDDEFYLQNHVQYENAEKERLIENARIAANALNPTAKVVKKGQKSRN